MYYVTMWKDHDGYENETPEHMVNVRTEDDVLDALAAVLTKVRMPVFARCYTESEYNSRY